VAALSLVRSRRVASLSLSLIAAACGLSGCGGEDPPAAPPPDGPRVELADERALAELTDWRRLPTFGEGRYLQTGSQDREREPPIVPLLKNGNRDMNNFVCASADAIMAEAQAVPFTFDEPACPEPYVRGAVLARFEGAGRLARLWMTMTSIRGGREPDEEVLRIYVDDAPTPVVEAPLAAILDGSAGEMFAPPFGAGPGDHLAWYYPVVFAEKLVIAIDQLGPLDLYYHQAAVVLDLDAEPSARAAAATRLPARDAAKETLGATAEGPVPGGQVLLDAEAVTLAPEVATALADITGAGTIHEFGLKVPVAALPSLDAVELEVTWDDAPEPAMRLPLAELFAASLAPPEGQSLALAGAVSGGEASVALRLPMPHASSARFVATNGLPDPIDLRVTLRVEHALPPEPWGHLHAQRNETVEPASSPLHPLASVSGRRGRWAGTCMMMQGRGIGDGTALDNPYNFLEGDEVGRLDGEAAVIGTGTEDYFNGAFYFESGAVASPFAQWWGVEGDDMAAQASACRFHVLGDAIDFAQSAEITVEVGPADPAMLERYRSVAFFYLEP